jgi:hypothetical protein
MSIGDGKFVYVTSNIGAGSGYVGIGTSTPIANHSLTVSGDVRVHGALTSISEDISSITGTSLTINWGSIGKKIIGINNGGQAVTVTFGTPPPGPTFLTIVFVLQSAVGGVTFTGVKWPGGDKLDMVLPGGTHCVINFFYDGTDYYGVGCLDYK